MCFYLFTQASDFNKKPDWCSAAEMSFQQILLSLLRTSETILQWLLVNSLTKVALVQLIRLAGRPTLRRVLAVPNIHFKVAVLLEPVKALEIIFAMIYSSLQNAVVEFLGLHDLFFYPHKKYELCNRKYSEFNLPQVDPNQVLDTSQKPHNWERHSKRSEHICTRDFSIFI